jgi:hypothetical protein
MPKKISESHDLFERIKLIMNYNVSKTLTENITNEQVLTGIGILRPDTSLNFSNWIKSFDTHDWFTTIQLSLMFLGFFTGGITSVIALGLAGAAGLAEAKLYFDEGDPYMGTLMLIFGLIPGDEILKLPVIGEVVKKYGVKGVKELIKKNKEGVKLTSNEIKDLKKLGEGIASESGQLNQLFKSNIKKRLLLEFSKKSTKWLLNFLLMFRKTRVPIWIAGTWIPFDYLYIYAFRDDIQKMNLRDKNTFLNIIRWVGEKIGWKQITPQDLEPEVVNILENLNKAAENGQIEAGEWVRPEPTEEFNKNIGKK